MSILWWLKLPLHFREIRRLREILTVLARHGFEDVSIRLAGVRVFRWFLKSKSQATSLPIEKRIRLVLEELGPTFVKLGQIMATRPDIVPMSLIQELQKLQDEVPPVPFEEVRQLIERDLGKPLESLFKDVVAQPIAAASIAQVYRAHLLDGKEVVIKVQRPDAKRIVTADMRILKILAEALESRIPEIRRFKPRQLLQEFADTITDELDFLSEMENLQRYRENFKDEEMLHIPQPYPELCSKRVLVMEAVNGTKITDVKTLQEKGIDLHKVLEIGMSVTLRSIFEFGFFHADPHPGNFFVEDDGKIALIDFGMMGVLDDERIDDILIFLVSIVTADSEEMIRLLQELDLIPDNVDVRRLKNDIARLLVRYRNTNIGNIDTSLFLNRIYEVMGRYNVSLPADLMLVGKAVSTLEGIGRQIFPDFKPMDTIKPYLIDLYTNRILDPNRQLARLYRTGLEIMRLFRDAPYDLRRSLKKLRSGELNIVLQSPQIDSVKKGSLASSNKLLYGFLSIGYGALGILARFLLNSTWLEGGAFAISGFFFIMLLYTLLISSN